MSTPIPAPTTAALRLAAEAGCDPRTAARVLRDGPTVVRGAYLRERLTLAMRDLGLLEAHGQP